ncbi:MAG: DUF1599 domain-containing protein [Thermoguttaceae bacterium]|nr:DUF1599 domain-containing protein [Thermoguttaceae bacterium]
MAKFDRTIDALRELLVAKNHDYGSSAFESPLLLPTMKPETGVLVRIGDKIKRLQTLARNSQYVDESFDDTIRDLAGYCILYLACKETDD